MARKSSKGSDRASSRESNGPYHGKRTPAITDAGALVPYDDMDVTSLPPPDHQPMNPENHPGEEPSASSSTYVQNSMHQEQHNQFATVNILKQGPDEEAVRQLISQEAQHVGQKVYETTAGEVTDQVESLKGHQAREMALSLIHI